MSVGDYYEEMARNELSCEKNTSYMLQLQWDWYKWLQNFTRETEGKKLLRKPRHGWQNRNSFGGCEMNSSGSYSRPAAGFSEHGNNTLGSVNSLSAWGTISVLSRTKVWQENLKGRNYLKDLGVGGRMMLSRMCGMKCFKRRTSDQLFETR
jgi:hypothetical protein